MAACEIVSNGDRVELRGTVRQAPGPLFKKVHVPLVLEFAGGRQEVRLVFQEQPEQAFSFMLPAKPDKVSVDPGHTTLAYYR